MVADHAIVGFVDRNAKFIIVIFISNLSAAEVLDGHAIVHHTTLVVIGLDIEVFELLIDGFYIAHGIFRTVLYIPGLGSSFFGECHIHGTIVGIHHGKVGSGNLGVFAARLGIEGHVELAEDTLEEDLLGVETTVVTDEVHFIDRLGLEEHVGDFGLEVAALELICSVGVLHAVGCSSKVLAEVIPTYILEAVGIGIGNCLFICGIACINHIGERCRIGSAAVVGRACPVTAVGGIGIPSKAEIGLPCGNMLLDILVLVQGVEAPSEHLDREILFHAIHIVLADGELVVREQVSGSVDGHLRSQTFHVDLHGVGVGQLLLCRLFLEEVVVVHHRGEVLRGRVRIVVGGVRHDEIVTGEVACGKRGLQLGKGLVLIGTGNTVEDANHILGLAHFSQILEDNGGVGELLDVFCGITCVGGPCQGLGHILVEGTVGIVEVEFGSAYRIFIAYRIFFGITVLEAAVSATAVHTTCGVVERYGHIRLVGVGIERAVGDVLIAGAGRKHCACKTCKEQIFPFHKK